MKKQLILPGLQVFFGGRGSEPPTNRIEVWRGERRVKGHLPRWAAMPWAGAASRSFVRGVTYAWGCAAASVGPLRTSAGLLML